jgi:hypothetical protein
VRTAGGVSQEGEGETRDRQRERRWSVWAMESRWGQSGLGRSSETRLLGGADGQGRRRPGQMRTDACALGSMNGTVDGAFYRRMIVELRPRSRTAGQTGQVSGWRWRWICGFKSRQQRSGGAPSYMYGWKHAGGALVSQRRRPAVLRSRARHEWPAAS